MLPTPSRLTLSACAITVVTLATSDALAQLMNVDRIPDQRLEVVATEKKPGRDKLFEFSFHGEFDHRFILYTNQINFTPSNKARTSLTTTASGTRADLWPWEGTVPPGSPPGTRPEILSGHAQTEEPPDLPRLDGVADTLGEIRYRPRMEVRTRDGFATGLIELELGGIRFGASGQFRGGSFSADGVNIETRLAFANLNFSEHHLTMGLIPFNANHYLWNEATAGIQLAGPLSDLLSYRVAWVRGREDRRRPEDVLRLEEPPPGGLSDMDGIHARIDATFGDSRLGAFALYQFGAQDAEDQFPFGTFVYAEGYSLFQFPTVDFNLLSAGVDGQLNFGGAFIRFDGIFQAGTFRNVNFFAADNFRENFGNAEADALARELCPQDTAGALLPAEVLDNLSTVAISPTGMCSPEITQTAFAARLQAGYELPTGTTITGTFSYVSGDDNPADTDWGGFLSTDVDVFDSAIFHQGVLANDTVHRQDPYLFDKGYLLAKVLVEQRLGDLTLGAAGVINRLAQPLTWSGVPTPDGTNPAPDLTLNPDANEDKTPATWTSDDLGIEAQLLAHYRFTDHVFARGLFAFLPVPGPAFDFFEVGYDRNGVADVNYVTAQANVMLHF